ncbi:unnamed protein product, partial [Mesorhabditis belari]|uniref:Uncharacterized protein n=1 Tax=Mesorhabditis belari TaxID=2138241 RepID=A0AAF3EGK5_9BILA
MDVSPDQLDAATRAEVARTSRTIDQAQSEEDDGPTEASQPSELTEKSRPNDEWIVDSIRQDYYRVFVWLFSVLLLE